MAYKSVWQHCCEMGTCVVGLVLCSIITLPKFPRLPPPPPLPFTLKLAPCPQIIDTCDQTIKPLNVCETSVHCREQHTILLRPFPSWCSRVRAVLEP